MTSSNSSPCWVYRFPAPKTYILSFEGTFQNVDENTKVEFKKLTQMREDMRLVLDQDSPLSSINAIEKYLPHLLGLINATDSLPQDFMKMVKINWTTVIGTKYSVNSLMCTSFKWELVMILIAYAIFHRNYAADLFKDAILGSNETSEEKIKLASKNLLKSAGIFQHIQTEQLSKWFQKPEGLPEMTDDIYVALTSVCLAEAQELAIRKAIKTTSKGLISKLAIDVSQKYQNAYDSIKKIKNSEQVLPPFMNYINSNIALWKGLAYQYVAELHYENAQFGASVTFITQACLEFKDFPKDSSLDAYFVEYNQSKQQCKKMAEIYSHDNDTIYYESVTAQTAVEPETKSIVKADTFQLPDAIPVSIVIKEGACNIM